MLSLREIQSTFCDCITSGDSGPMLRLVRAPGIGAEASLQIYRNRHRLTVLATLQTAFPVIERLGGADWFAHSALRYQQQFPSRSGDLQHLGELYPQFLQAELAATAYDYFADVAALEWAYQEVLTAAEQPPADLTALHGFRPEEYPRLLFVPRPAVRTLDSPFPMFAIWQANRLAMNEPERSSAEIRLDAGASRVVLIRRHDHIDVRELDPGCYQLLRQFQRGAPLALAAQEAAAVSADFELARSLAQVARLGAIGSIELVTDEQDSTMPEGMG